MVVVEVFELPKCVEQVGLVPDECAVEEFSATGLYPPLHDGVHSGYADAAEYDLNSTTGVLDHREHVQSRRVQREDFEEVAGQQRVGLGAEKLCPGGGGAFGCGVDAGVLEDLPHGRWRDCDSENQ